MSDFADDMQAMREESQKKKAKRLKWNTDVILHLSAELEFEMKQHSEHHFSFFHKQNGRLDYWPSTQKACWFKNKKPGKTFVIGDIEAYILKHFNK